MLDNVKSEPANIMKIEYGPYNGVKEYGTRIAFCIIMNRNQGGTIRNIIISE